MQKKARHMIFHFHTSFSKLAIFFSVFFLLSSFGQNVPQQVTTLKADYLKNPIGLESAPLLSWQILASGENVRQSAYQVLVASSQEKLNETKADLWNSGKVFSVNSTQIPYEGKSLSSGKRAYWKVRTWDQNGNATKYSDVAFWEMGLFEQQAWKAKWISAVEETDGLPPVLPSPYFRKEFSVTGKVSSARLYISGLGYYEAFINGRKVGDHVLDPALTRYDKRVKYVAYDVSEQVKSGQNAIGVVLGNGWYNQHTRTAWDFDKAPWRESPALLCQLVIYDENGISQVIKTDESWKYSNGPIVFNSVHNGETYDARRELGSWNEAGYDEVNWNQIVSIDGPAGELSSQLMPPIRVTDSLPPVKTWKVNDTLMMADLGQNITGWAHLKVKGPAGSMVRLRYGERIFDDGTLDQKELSRFIRTGDTQTDRYILKGKGVEAWHPVFTYHGFQYIEVSSANPNVELEELKGDVVHSDLERRGYFRCSNGMFNRLQENIGWSFLGNYHGYPTDCPHREKMGWTGDAALVAETGLFNFDMAPAYLKWIDDFIDEQQDDGQLPGIIPTSGWGYTYGKDENRERGYGPQWEGAFMEIPWQIYAHTGDTAMLDKYFPAFKKYVDYLTAHSKGHLLNFGIDDHKQLIPLTHGDFLASAYYYRYMNMISKMAEATGRKTEALKYARQAGRIKSAFNQRYYDEESGSYAHGGQTPLALALYFGLYEKEAEEKVLQNLIKAIEEKDGHIDAGVVGTKAVINALLLFGQDRVLYDLANKRDFPGWGYWVDELDANTMYQNWDGSQSRNHIMFGSIGDYFFKGLAGINVNDTVPGFRHFVISPSFDNDITWVEAGYESMYGMIASHWRKEGEKVTLKVTIPPNSSAAILLPGSISDLHLNDRKLNPATIKRISNTRGEFLKYVLGSGVYEFDITH